MKSQLLGLLAVALLAGPMVADAYVVTISGTPSSNGQWDITAQFGSFNSLSATLTAQEWWGNSDLAATFASELGGGLGYVNGGWGPLFAISQAGDLVTSRFCLSANPCPGFVSTNQYSGLNWEWYFAVASRVPEPVPLPAAAWLLLSGLAGVGFIGRRKAH